MKNFSTYMNEAGGEPVQYGFSTAKLYGDEPKAAPASGFSLNEGDKWILNRNVTIDVVDASSYIDSLKDRIIPKIQKEIEYNTSILEWMEENERGYEEWDRYDKATYGDYPSLGGVVKSHESAKPSFARFVEKMTIDALPEYFDDVEVGSPKWNNLRTYYQGSIVKLNEKIKKIDQYNNNFHHIALKQLHQEYISKPTPRGWSSIDLYHEIKGKPTGIMVRIMESINNTDDEEWLFMLPITVRDVLGIMNDFVLAGVLLKGNIPPQVGDDPKALYNPRDEMYLFGDEPDKLGPEAGSVPSRNRPPRQKNIAYLQAIAMKTVDNGLSEDVLTLLARRPSEGSTVGNIPVHTIVNRPVGISSPKPTKAAIGTHSGEKI